LTLYALQKNLDNVRNGNISPGQYVLYSNVTFEASITLLMPSQTS
jgi:hypothetical protein